MTRTVSEGFDEFVRRLVPTDAQRNAGMSHRATVRQALEARLVVSTFSETGSFSHGTGVRGHSDIDALAALSADRPGSSATALNWVKEALQARFPLTSVTSRRPAVVVAFASGYETWEVIPGFMTARGGAGQYVYDIPEPGSQSGWIDSAPQEHLEYVSNANAKPRGKAKRLARLIKAWKYFCDVPISSFYLEMRCASYLNRIDTYVDIWDVRAVLRELKQLELAAMNDPSGAAGRIRACSSDATRTTALSRLSTAATRVEKAFEAYRAENDADAFYYLNLLFGGKFPAR